MRARYLDISDIKSRETGTETRSDTHEIENMRMKMLERQGKFS